MGMRPRSVPCGPQAPPAARPAFGDCRPGGAKTEWIRRPPLASAKISDMNILAALLPPDAPISATVLEAFVLATLALVFLALARRDREPGLAWLSAGFGATVY